MVEELKKDTLKILSLKLWNAVVKKIVADIDNQRPFQ